MAVMLYRHCCIELKWNILYRIKLDFVQIFLGLLDDSKPECALEVSGEL